MRRVLFPLIAIILAAAILLAVSFWIWRAGYPRPYREILQKSEVEENLVFAIAKAESDFQEDAVSSAGAIGLMQLMPSTAEFVCSMHDIGFEPERLTEGEYNMRLGCLYLEYLLGRFACRETAIAAYNAGEGVVDKWLREKKYSRDGERLRKIPYPETARYVKKVEKNFRIYRFLYRE